MKYPTPLILPAGDAALVVEFGDDVSPETNRSVHDTAAAIEREGVAGIVDLVPSYRSLLLQYDPLKTTHHQVAEAVEGLLDTDGAGSAHSPVVVCVPVLYGGEYGPDVETVAEHNGLTVDEVVELHSEPDYLVYMLGFSPGFPYLGGLSERLATPRLETPRVEIPAGSVGIAETQTGVYPVASPGGWQLIGRTPLRFFDPDEDPPAVIRAGDYVRFVPLSGEDEYHRISGEIERGEYETVKEPVA